MDTATLTAAAKPPGLCRLSRRLDERGLSQIVVLAAIAVLAVAAVVVWRYQSRSGPPPEDIVTAPSSGTAPASPAQDAPPAALSAATRIGAETDPAFQKAEVATDPTFKEARGQLLPGIPSIAAYPGATLVGSAEQGRAGESAEGYRIKWTTRDSVATVMAWYQKTLPSQGWSYVPPDDGAPGVEEVARISKGELTGSVAAEATGDLTEIVVSLKRKSR